MATILTQTKDSNMCDHPCLDALPQISVSGDLEGSYVVLARRACGVLRIAPQPSAGLPRVQSLKKTCTACPSQWEGTLGDGRALYARYRWGELTVGLGENVDEAVENSRSADALVQEYVGDGLDGFMNVEELRVNLLGLIDFPTDLDVEGEREPFTTPPQAPPGP